MTRASAPPKSELRVDALPHASGAPKCEKCFPLFKKFLLSSSRLRKIYNVYRSFVGFSRRIAARLRIYVAPRIARIAPDSFAVADDGLL